MAGQTWLHYYLYGLERVGRFTARRFIGDADWYLEGAKMFISTQDNLTGAFRGGRIEDPVVATSFALLFLAKGRRPVIVAKSRHAPDSDWNRHGHDIAHLVEHVESRWKKDYPAGLSWHIVETQTATLEDLLPEAARLSYGLLQASTCHLYLLEPGSEDLLGVLVDDLARLECPADRHRLSFNGDPLALLIQNRVC